MSSFGLTVSLVGRAMCGRDRGRVRIFLEQFGWPIASRLPIFKERFLFSSKPSSEKGARSGAYGPACAFVVGFFFFFFLLLLLLLCYAATLFV